MKRKASAKAVGRSAAKRHCAKKTDATSASTGGKTLSDLNDYCLFEIFKYLDLKDWTAIADVSSRLKQAAQAHFAHSSNRKFQRITFPRDIPGGLQKVPAGELLSNTSKILRNFGSSITQFCDVDDAKSSFQKESKKAQAKYRRRLFGLITRYCNENLRGLKLTRFTVTDRMASELQPLVGLQYLSLNACETRDSLVEALPTWCPDLCVLGFFTTRTKGEKVKVLRFDGLHQSFPALKWVVFNEVDNLLDRDIGGLLRCNQQIEKMHISRCRYVNERLVEPTPNMSRDWNKPFWPSSSNFFRSSL